MWVLTGSSSRIRIIVQMNNISRGKLFPKQLFLDWETSDKIGIILKSIVIVNKVPVFLWKDWYTNN